MINCEIIINSPLWEEHKFITEEFLVGLCEVIFKEVGLAKKILKAEFCANLTDSEEIKSLNKEYRGQEKDTNILSFPVMDKDAYEIKSGQVHNCIYIGDLALSHSALVAEAQEYNWPFQEYFTFIFTHGFLHLLGFDHDSKENTDEMEALEAKILANFGINSPY